MSVMQPEADVCYVCDCYSNSGFDICEDCATQKERNRIINLITNMYFPDEKQLECQKIIINKLRNPSNKSKERKI